jgi:hypothetical protein
MSAKIAIFRNREDEDVARVTFDENFPRGWRIESKALQGFDHKFSTAQAACDVWHQDFDLETGKLWK